MAKPTIPMVSPQRSRAGCVQCSAPVMDRCQSCRPLSARLRQVATQSQREREDMFRERTIAPSPQVAHDYSAFAAVRQVDLAVPGPGDRDHPQLRQSFDLPPPYRHAIGDRDGRASQPFYYVRLRCGLDIQPTCARIQAFSDKTETLTDPEERFGRRGPRRSHLPCGRPPIECRSEKPPQIMSAGHTSSSATSRLVQNERPNATRIHVATVIPSNGHNQSQFDGKRLVELVSIALLMPSILIGDSKTASGVQLPRANHGKRNLTAPHASAAGRFPRQIQS